MSSTGDHRRLTVREHQASVVRDRLVDAAMSLCERGQEPTMRSVAREGGVSERTIYRYFPNHDALAQALQPRIARRAGVPLCARADELETYAASLFATFEANRALIVALVSSGWAAPYLEKSRRRNLQALRRLLDEAYPDAAVSKRAAAAASVRVLLSGSGWHYLRVSCGLSARAVTDHARWTIRCLTEALAADA